MSESAVQLSRKKHGSNALSKKKRDPFIKKYLQSFGDPMIRVLLVALAVNLIVMIRSAQWYEPLGITASILIATLISTLSEWGSESAFEKLQADAAKIRCKVRRGGNVKEVAIDEIVVGDRIILQTGDKIPADGILAEGKIYVDQSSLNGESKEAFKRQDTRGKGQDEGLNSRDDESHNIINNPADFLAPSSLFRGTVVCQGEGEMVVTAVGNNSFYGRMAQEIQQDTRKSPLHIRLTELAKTISRLGYTCSGLVGLAYIFQKFWSEFGGDINAFLHYYSSFPALISDLMNLITLIVTVIVVAVPEGLPMMITVVLSANIRKMQKDNVLVRKMTGIETAGSMNILFTDKTGTLTRGKFAVHTLLTGNGLALHNLKDSRIKKDYLTAVTVGCGVNTSAAISNSRDSKKGRKAIGGNATDRALLEFVQGEEKIWDGIQKSGSVPFSSASKFSSAKITGDEILIKGSPDMLIPLCTKYMDENGTIHQSGGFLKLKNEMAALSSQSVRLIALCRSDNLSDLHNPQRGLTLVAVLGVRDGIRSETPATIKQMREAGIQVVMITGDSKETATAIAKECGLATNKDDIIITSRELAEYTDEQVKTLLTRLRVIARALPSDKSRMVRLSQDAGLVVGMTGDGVNDAPALKAADVGFGMGSGTEVAKEASDVVILDDNIKSIGKAVLYGRTIFKSVRKFIIYQLTSNLCAVGLSVIGPIMGIDTPITVMQMLWINLVMDTLAGIAFSGEAPKLKYMKEKPKPRDEKILNGYMISSILTLGGYALILSLLFWKLPILSGFVRSEMKYHMTAFFALFMFMAIFNSFPARTHSTNLMSYLSRNKPFIVIIAGVFAVQIAMLYVGGSLFRTAGLTFGELWRVLSLAATVLPLDVLRKWIMRKMGHPGGV